ncbi:hypothetical protein [Methanobrevibacter curvatus]|nr:hypothetical protein [Methanobrevibacter curvatus]
MGIFPSWVQIPVPALLIILILNTVFRPSSVFDFVLLTNICT